jgi:hypothetical protein
MFNPDQSLDNIDLSIKLNNNKVIARFPNTNKYLGQNKTLRWIDIMSNDKENCQFCGSFYSTVCIVCGSHECDPKPDISIKIKGKDDDKVIHTMQYCYDYARKHKNYEQIGITINTLNKYNIEYDFNYIYDNDSSDIDIFPKYKDLIYSLELAVKNLDLNKVIKLINLHVIPNSSILFEVIKINYKYSFESDYEVATRIANIILKEFYQIEKRLVLYCITTGNNHLIELFLDRCVLDEDIYFYVAMLGHLTILQDLDRKECPKNYLALIGIASNDLLTFARRIKIMRYLVNTGCKKIPKLIFSDQTIILEPKIKNWLKANCELY